MISRSKIYRTFLSGLVTTVPVLLTVALLGWLAVTAERLFGGMFKWLIGDFLYLPGMGIVMGILAIFLVGLTVNIYLVQRVIQGIERRFHRLPLVKTIYGPIKDVFSFLGQGGSHQKDIKRVVLVDLEEPKIKALGLVTRDDFSGLCNNLPEDHVAVLIPMSYAIGGYTAIVHKDRLTEIDLPIDKAMTLAITGWMKK